MSKVYVLVLTSGRYEEKHVSVIRAHTNKEAAETDKLETLVKLEEIVRKGVRVGKLLDDWIDENPAPALAACKCCTLNGNELCDACTGWNTLYDIAKDSINKDVGFDPASYPLYANEGFWITIHEVELSTEGAKALL